MANYKVIIPIVIGLFIWQGIAEAASISTRVRILESKVSKQDKKIRQSSNASAKSAAKVDKSMASVKVLERKVNRLIKESNDIKRGTRSADFRYTFP